MCRIARIQWWPLFALPGSSPFAVRREACDALKSIDGIARGKLSSSASSSRRCFLPGEGFLSSFMTLSVEAASA
jgi:hypothetical protein